MVGDSKQTAYDQSCSANDNPIACHSDRSRSVSDGAVEEPAVPSLDHCRCSTKKKRRDPSA